MPKINDVRDKLSLQYARMQKEKRMTIKQSVSRKILPYTQEPNSRENVITVVDIDTIMRIVMIKRTESQSQRKLKILRESETTVEKLATKSTNMA